MRNHGKKLGAWLTALCVTLAAAGVANAQQDFFSPLFLGQTQAAQKAVTIAVEQGIQSMPPASGQAMVWRKDPQLDTMVAGRLLGPTVFRTPLTLGSGVFDIRLSSSYFKISKDFGNVFYEAAFLDAPDSQFATAFGLSTEAEVWMVNVGGNIGVTDNLELSVNFPVVSTHATAATRYTTTADCAATNTCDVVRAVIVEPGQTAQQAVLGDPGLQLLSEPLGGGNLNIPFDSGDGVGLGRVSLGGKYNIVREATYGLAVGGDVFIASPSSERYAGADSWAITPRLIGAWWPAEGFGGYLDLAYDHDFSEAALRRFSWNVGGSYAQERFSVDLGFGGAEYNDGIRWSPDSLSGTLRQSDRAFEVTAAQGDTKTGSSYASFLFGTKLRIVDGFFFSGALNLPMITDGVPPNVIGTIALEGYF